jgi:threonine dehydrogenase-like Zn-dependent dehydrogenase
VPFADTSVYKRPPELTDEQVVFLADILPTACEVGVLAGRDCLVDTFTTPKLLRLIAEGRLDPTPFATHRFELEEMIEAYDSFAEAASTNALKVVLSAHPVHLSSGEKAVAATA